MPALCPLPEPTALNPIPRWVNRYQSKRGIWLEKMDMLPVITESDRKRNEMNYFMGHAHEKTAVQGFMMLHGLTDEHVYQTAYSQHPDYPWAKASTDWRYVDEPNGLNFLIEVKATSVRMRHEWGKPGTDEMPKRVMCQTEWYCFVTGIPDVIVLLMCDNQVIEYRHKSNKKIQDWLFRLAKAFWFDHCVPKVCPPPDEHPANHGVDAALHDEDMSRPRDFYRELTSDPIDEAADQAHHELLQQHGEEDALHGRMDKNRQTIKDAIDNDPGVKTSSGICTWKTNKNGSRVFLDGYRRAEVHA